MATMATITTAAATTTTQTITITTRRVEIVGHYNVDEPFDADPDEEVKTDRRPESLRSLPMTTSMPYNWDCFCDSADEVFKPLTLKKNYYLEIGKVSYVMFNGSLVLSIILMCVMDTAWFNHYIPSSIILWLFLPIPIFAISAIVKMVVDCSFYEGFLCKIMHELSGVCYRYSGNGVRYEVGCDWINNDGGTFA